MKAKLQFLLLTVVSLTLQSNIVNAQSAVKHDESMALAEAFTCGETTELLMSEMTDTLLSVPDGIEIAGSAFDVCNGTREKTEFTLPDQYEFLDAVFLFKTKSMGVEEYWVFVFRNDEDITSSVLGDNNLVSVVNEAFTLPLKIDKTAEVISSISVLGIDANMVKTDAARNNNFFVSASIKDSSSKSFSPTYISGNETHYDPSPEYISYESKISSTNDKRELILSVDDEYDELNFVAVNFRSGKRIPLRCGDVPGRGISSVKSTSNIGAVATSCVFPDKLEAKDVVVAITTDYFSYLSEKYGAFHHVFARMLRTH